MYFLFSDAVKGRSIFAGRVHYGVTDKAIEGTWVCDGTGQTIAKVSGPQDGSLLFADRQPDNTLGMEHFGYGRPFNDFLIDDSTGLEPYSYLCEKP